MKTVFHIISSFDLGGAERVAINISKSESANFKYHIVEVLKGDSDYTNKLLAECLDSNIVIHRAPFRNSKLSIILFPFWFYFIYSKYKPAIIHTHTEIPDLSIFLFSRIFKEHRLYIRTIHNTKLWSSWNRIGAVVERFFIKHNSSVAISKSTYNAYKERYLTGNIPTIFNGIPETVTKPFPKQRRGCRNILFAGRLEQQKGVKELVEVVNALKSDNRYHFHIVGDGSLQCLLGKLEGENYTTYDKIYNLSSFIGAFDYLFMPSNFEGLGLLSIESSMSKTPVIVNNCAGLNETIPHDWPLIVDNNSVDAYVDIFANQLERLDYDSLGNLSYNFVKQRFSIYKMQQSYENLYKTRINET